MTSFFNIYFVWIPICVCLVSAEAEIPVSGHVGSTVILPCNLPSVDTETPHIRWLIGSETVFERRGEDSYQGSGYEGRVDVPEDELRKGNCSLVLHNLTLTDAGVYKSYQIVRHTKRSAYVMKNAVSISRVTLSVDETCIIPPNDIGSNSKVRGISRKICLHPQIMVLSLISWLLMHRFMQV